MDTIDQEAFINCKKLKRVSIQTGMTKPFGIEHFPGALRLKK